jgi:hypothetical protein
MNKNLFAGVALLILTLLGVWIYSGIASKSDNKKQSLQIQLSSAISKHKNSELICIDFADVFPFAWEKVYFFGPYTTPAKIDAVLNTFWIRSRFLSIDSNDGVTLIVFTNAGRVVEYLEYPRWIGDFSNLDTYPAGFISSVSCFIIDERGRAIWVGERLP